MGRARSRLKWRHEGKQYVIRYLDPLKQAPRRLVVGMDSTQADRAVNYLNRIFGDASAWYEKPADVPDDIWTLWTGGRFETVRLSKPRDSIKHSHYVTMVKALEDKERRIRELEEEIVFWKGKRTRNGPAPRLGEAFEQFMADYKGKDDEHTRNMRCHLQRFVERFGAEKNVDDFSGAEKQIDTWLQGLVNENGPRDEKGKLINPEPISPGYRNQFRDRVLMFLEHAGVVINRKEVKRASRGAVRASRGPIRWLEREQVEAVADALDDYWSDVWRVQVGLGLRPTELITLQRSNFNSDYSECTLAQLGDHTLKTGSRSLQVSEITRTVLKRRIAVSGSKVVFPQVNYRNKKNHGKPWHDEHWFCRKYVRMLRAAVAAVNEQTEATLGADDPLVIHVDVDARTGRRTSGSLLLRADWTLEAVAAFLGDDLRTVKEHYAALLSNELNPKAAAV